MTSFNADGVKFSFSFKSCFYMLKFAGEWKGEISCCGVTGEGKTMEHMVVILVEEILKNISLSNFEKLEITFVC